MGWWDPRGQNDNPAQLVIANVLLSLYEIKHHVLKSHADCYEETDENERCYEG